MSVFPGRLSQAVDVQGSITHIQNKTQADENLKKGVKTSNGGGDSFAKAGNVITLTDAEASFTSADIGRVIVILSATTNGNNGQFIIEDVPSGITLKYTNSLGAAEAFPGTWEIDEPYCLEDDINFVRTDRQKIKGTTNFYDAVPTYVRPDATGTPVDKNLTTLQSVDKYATVVDVCDAGTALRPGITAADGALLIADETFTTTGYHFTSADLNSFIQISGSTDANGIYRIDAVTDGKTLELNGLASATAEACTWALLSGTKGILSSTLYATAAKRTGLPIADSGALDETDYDATFTDCIDPAIQGRPSTNAELPIWARSFGNDKEPKRGADDNDGVRFFAQLKTGLNTVAAADTTLESLAGRSGAAGSVTNGTKAITGLTGMTQEDIGRYISLWNCSTAGNCGHFEILTIVSATSVTVDKVATFTTDAGALKWQISKHGNLWDFYNGNRVRNDLLAETWARRTLIGGIVSDAELTQAIADLREFTGESPHQTSPDLGVNTGNYFVWSNLPSTSDTNLEELCNELNEQIGNRDYSSEALGNVPNLADGQTITASIEYLAVAIGQSKCQRTIERLPDNTTVKQTPHLLPGGLTYKLDDSGAANGRYLWVFWRGILRRPGTVANKDEYSEADTTHITPYTDLKKDDAIDYIILAND